MRALDTETYLIRPGLEAPPLVCVSWADERGSGLALKEDAHRFVLEDQSPFVLHNSGFDLCVLAEHLGRIDWVFDRLDAGSVSDTLVREKLLDIATGQKFYRDGSGKTLKRVYDLAALVRKYLGVELDKSADTWRLRYAELDGVPLEQWPDDARNYARLDAEVTLKVWQAQEERRARVGRELGGDPLADEARQVRRLFALQLMRTWGIRTDPKRIESLETITRTALEKLAGDLMTTGLVRADYTRDTKAAKARMIRVCAENGVPVVLTDTGEKKIKEGTLPSHAAAVEAGYIALDADTCKRSGDLALQHYCEITSHKLVLSRDCKRFRDGTRFPIHTRINSILDTGRPSSSDPNLFNTRNLPGIRECFVPRAGRWFLDVDISGLELATLAQVLLKLIGHSQMAETILRYGSAGALHTILAAKILDIPIEEAFRREALGKKADPEFYNARQTAKVANFGFPGGLGITSLIYFARSKYGVPLTEERAKWLKRLWLETWPEMRAYFDLISRWCEEGGGQCTIRQLFSDRYRGACFYTQACNGFFQALGADGTGHALYEIMRACYDAREQSPLFGARVVNYVYDQYVLEVPADLERANAMVDALTPLVENETNRFLPDVPIKLGDPVLCECWSKEAKSIRNEKGQLLCYAA